MRSTVTKENSAPDPDENMLGPQDISTADSTLQYTQQQEEASASGASYQLPTQNNPQQTQPDYQTQQRYDPPGPAQRNRTHESTHLKLPQFWVEDPEMWFFQSENELALNDIMDEQTRYRHLLKALPQTILAKVREVVMAQPRPINPYSELKRAILERTGLSNRERYMTILSQQPIGDQKPSEILRHFRQLIPDIPEDMLRELFLQKLPNNCQQILAAGSTTSVNQLAQQADKILEISNAQSINSVEQQPNEQVTLMKNMVETMAELQTQINEIRLNNQNTNHFRQSRQETAGRGRGGFRGRGGQGRESPERHREISLERQNPKPGEKCWYCTTFGSRAFKCFCKPKTQNHEQSN
jgi:hypothetical protein